MTRDLKVVRVQGMWKYEKEYPQEGNNEAQGESLLAVFEGKQRSLDGQRELACRR